MKHIYVYTFIFCFFIGMGTDSFGQDPDKPDLRTCGICKGQTRNYSILNVYFSDSNGSPNIVCGDSDETSYVSILYSSNSNSAIHNVRIIAEIEKRNRSNPNGDPISEIYINEFIGRVDPCPDGTCLFTFPLSTDFQIDCENEFYEFSDPLVAWTPNGKDNLRDSYECIIDYSPGQCLNEQTIPIEVGELLYSFEPIFNCFSGEITQTNVSYVLNSLFGGNPTLPYSFDWEFTFPDGTPTQNSTEFNPVVLNRASGSVVNAILTVSQGSFDGPIISKEITVPMALSRNDVIEDVDKSDTDEGMSNGIIEVTFSQDKDLFYFWTSLDDSGFYSELSRIENLPAGTYELTTINNDTGTCRTDLFDISASILPVDFTNIDVNYNFSTRTTSFSWATSSEWESSHFEIERSNSGINGFEKVGSVSTMGWKDTVTEYEFIDSNLPLYGGNILYRIKQVDLDEQYAYSEVMSIRAPEVETIKGVWRAYPNPTYDGRLRINLLDRYHYQGENISYRILHPTFNSQLITVTSEAEMNDSLAQLLPSIVRGVFVVEIRWGQKVEHVKVLRL